MVHLKLILNKLIPDKKKIEPQKKVIETPTWALSSHENNRKEDQAHRLDADILYFHSPTYSISHFHIINLHTYHLPVGENCRE